MSVKIVEDNLPRLCQLRKQPDTVAAYLG